MKNIIPVIICLGLLLSTACEEDFLEVSDPNSLVTNSVFRDFETANQALNGAYSPLKDIDLWSDQIHFFFHQITNEYGLRSDALGFKEWTQMKDFSQTPDNVTITALWLGVSKMILRANGVIEGVADMEVPLEIGQEQKDQILGQAYFLRGFAHFLGVRVWGDQPASIDASAAGFPVITAVPETREQMLVSRATIAEVYAQIQSDLEQAEQLLPESWGNVDSGRATRGAASGYLGKIHLYRQNWDRAAEYFEKVINAGSYQLLENFEDNFNGNGENGSESIFEVQFSDKSPANGFGGGSGHIYATRHAINDLGGWGNTRVTQETFDTIKDDPRLGASVIQPGDIIPLTGSPFVGDGPDDYRPKKFIRMDENAISTGTGGIFNNDINMPLMRLADVYLMYAEAQNERGNTADALEYVNKVRRRAYVEPVDAPSVVADINVAGGGPLLQAIQNERFIELMGEGHRWFDLLRWGIADDVLGSRGFQPGKHEAMPIPLDEIQLNPAMEQNDGY